MDTGKSVEDQFSKLHPCFPVNTRIGIVGAGPSGLSAAYALAQLGYSNVTVLEKYQTVGGMCESVEIEGKIYDLGGQVLAANSAPVLFHLAKELGSELEELDSHKFALIDASTGKYQDMKVADDYLSVISLTLQLQDEAKGSGRIGVHALSEIASDPTPDFLKLHGFKSVPKSVAYGYTASGYGFVQDMPYAYIHEFTRTSMAGKIRRFKGGYMSVWQKLSQCLLIEVLCNTEVLAIQRNSGCISINVKNSNNRSEVLEFDKVIISGSFPFRNGRTYRSSLSPAETELMDMNELEKELFCKVQTIDYYTTVLKIKGLEHIPMGFYYFGEFMEDPATIGHPVAMQRFYANTDIFLFWSYGNSKDIMEQTVIKLAMDVVKNMGGQVEKVVLQRRFKYFPHVNSEDMKDGFYEKLETELQGLQNTYYIGGLMAFELTERNSSYAMAMVCKHFANDNPLPKFPYVKSLLPLHHDCHAHIPRELDELPRLEFPDLSTLDRYLKFWGTQRITENNILYTWINDEGEVVNQRTYAELHANASQIARMLLTSRKPVIKPGDRVLLVYVPGLDFIDAFFGCLRAKVIPVPVLPADPLQRGGQALLKIENISKSCNTVAILSTASYHAAVRAGTVKNMLLLARKNGISSGRWPDIPWLHTDSWIKKSKTNGCVENFADESEPQPDDLCFLQFTSGSTGDAKGVMITHGGLIHNVKLMRRRYKSTSRTVLISWLPQYHDMGLIGGIFTAMVSGGSAVLFSPMSFIKNPLLWLQTMSDYRATHSAGPNFAFELVIRRLQCQSRSYDLSSLVFLMVAAEPVRQKTLKRFIELCHPFGLSQEVMAPGYGLAENCVYVSCAFGEGRPILVDWQGRVCCGYVNSNDSDVHISIVDPETGEEHEEYGKEGEIWISSPSAGVGYWSKHEVSQKTFSNVLRNHPGQKFTTTGDLGRILDGKLFITGRIKDLIIVAGRNIYSADVEKTVENSSELLRPGCCAVVGVPEEILASKGITVPDSSDQVGLVVIAEVREGKPVDKEIINQIQMRVAEEHGVSVASVKLIKPKTISKTTSGKIRRFECLKQFQDGTLSLAMDHGPAKRSLLRSFTTGTCKEGKTPRSLQVKAPPFSLNAKRSKEEIIEFLKGLVSEQTGISVVKVSSTESLVSYGIDSIGVVRAAQKLSDYLGVPVGAVDIFTATCISDLASFSENLLTKAQPMNTQTHLSESERVVRSTTEISRFWHFCIGFLQLLALVYVAAMLILPVYLSSSLFLRFLHTHHGKTPFVNYLFPPFLAPIVWILCMVLTCISILFFGNSFLQPNYALKPEISIWTLDFVKWWALYKAQEVAGKVLAVHLRGTVFLNYWFEMLGARIGSSVLLDTIDITDPPLVSIGDGAVIAEGAMVQSHEVKDGILSFLPVRIGQNSMVGPYAVIQKGSVLGEEAEVGPLQKTEGGKCVFKTQKIHKVQKGGMLPEFAEKLPERFTVIYHFMGVYATGFLSSLSAAILYFFYIQLSQNSPSVEHLAFLCFAGAFHWFPATLVAYATIFTAVPSNPTVFSFYVAIAYITHGIILSLITCISTRYLGRKQESHQTHLTTWLRHRITTACHLRFAKLLSGTEAFCVYLRLLGAKIGQSCSIRAINPVVDPSLISIGDGVHLGDFSRVVAGFYSAGGFHCQKIEVQDNSVVGSQSLILPGSVLQEDVILGALSVAPTNSILQRGGIYVGSQTPVMVKNILHALDERIEEMDGKYKKIVGNLAANLAITTMKVKSRYFHRIGVSGRGILKMFDDLPGLPDHKIFGARKCYPIIIRHSNSLSADDDARIDARGAAVRILSDGDGELPLLDLTLKTGKAFYARTIADFATWLVCGLAAREAHVERAPHIRDAVWGSLRQANSYTRLHYYSNVCRLFRCQDGCEMYVKFKLRPGDSQINEDSGAVQPTGILPPETGAIPRDEKDTRPLLFLADDFQRGVNSRNGICYIFQMQYRPVPCDEADRETVLDCTRPWDETEFPFIDVGQITIDHSLTAEESERLEFNPFLRCHEVDIVRATSCSQSASIDHGRSLVYEICQHLRGGLPLPAAWRAFLDQSDVKVDLSGCPMAATLTGKNARSLTLARSWYQTMWVMFVQPLLQTFLPYFLLGLVVFGPLNLVLYMKETQMLPLHYLLPLLWVSSGILAALVCVVAKWVLVGKKKEGETVLIWSKHVFMDTIWQAAMTVVGDFFMEMTCGSVLFGFCMKLMGSDLGWDHGVYVDSMGAVLNPEMVEIERGGCVGREALLFGHIYEGEGGKVKYGKIRVGEGGFVGSRAVVMPGVRVESEGCLSALSLAMKEEIIK